MPDTMPRYMRAAKWNFDDAKKRLKGTMEWRRDFKPDLIPPDEVWLFPLISTQPHSSRESGQN